MVQNSDAGYVLNKLTKKVLMKVLKSKKYQRNLFQLLQLVSNMTTYIIYRYKILAIYTYILCNNLLFSDLMATVLIFPAGVIN